MKNRLIAYALIALLSVAITGTLYLLGVIGVTGSSAWVSLVCVSALASMALVKIGNAA